MKRITYFLSLIVLLLCMAVEANAATYTYYVLNKKGEATLWCEVIDQNAGDTPAIPNWMKSPLVKKYHYWLSSSCTKGTTARSNVSEYTFIQGDNNTTSDNLKYSWTVNNNATELETLPSSNCTIFVTYDVVDDFTINIEGKNVPIDLTGKTYYNIQDVNGWYAMILKDKVSTDKISKSTNRLINQALSIPLPGKSKMWYKANSSLKVPTTDCDTWAEAHGITSEADPQLLWSFHSSNNDPYDIQIKNKAVCELGHDDYILTDYDWTDNTKYYDAGSPSEWPEGKVDGLEYVSDQNLEVKVWQDNRIYVINPSNVSKTNGFKIYKFALLQGNAQNTIKIAEASICHMRFSKTYAGLRTFGLCNYLIDYESTANNNGTNTYRYAQEKVGGAIINGQSVDGSTATTDREKYYLYNDLYKVTITPTFKGNVTYHLIDKQGREQIIANVYADFDPLSSMPQVMKSANAKNYKFYTQDAFDISGEVYTLKEGATAIKMINDGMTDIYVKYDYDETSAIDLATSKDYNISVGGKYLVTDAEGNVVTVDECGDNDYEAWTISASTDGGSADPYHVTFASKGHSGKYLGVNAEGKLALVDTPQSFFLAKNSIGGYTIVKTESPTTDSGTGDLLMKSISYDAASGIIISSSASFGAKTNTELLDIANIYDFHIISLAGQELIHKRLSIEFVDNNISLPEALKSTYAKDYTFYSDESCLTQVNTTADLNGSKDIYVRYSYNPSHGGIDLTKTQNYTVQNESGQYLRFAGTTLTYLGSDDLSGEVLWQAEAEKVGEVFDPYLVSVSSRFYDGYNLAHTADGELTSNTTRQYFMITTTADGKTKLVDLGLGMKADSYTFTEVAPASYTYTIYMVNLKGHTGLWFTHKDVSYESTLELPNFMRSPLVSKYHYYSTELVKHTDDYDKGRPLYKCKYGNNSNTVQTNNTLAGLYKRGTEELTSWPRKDADIFVFYDVKPDEERIIDGVHIDLSGKSYYNIQDRFGSYVFMDKRYIKDTKTDDSQIFSYEYENLQKYLGVTSKTDAQMMWSFYSANDDPYDVQIKNKMISQTYPDLVVVESNAYNDAACPDCWPTNLGGDGDTHSGWSTGKKVYVLTPEMPESEYVSNFRINSFAFLQGTSADTIKLAGSIVGKWTSGNLQSFRYFGLRGYPNKTTRNGMTNVYFGLMRGENDTDVNKYLNNDLYRVQLTEYSDILTYHVINLSGKEVTSVSDYYAANHPCNLSEIVKSPFATNYKYYLEKDVAKAADGTITINEGATPIDAVPAGTKDIYVTYEYDAASSYNIIGRKGTLLYNISANGKYLATDGTNLTVATDSSKDKNNLWVIECNMVNGMPDPYDAHIYSWSNYDKYLGEETTLSLTDKAGSTSFILGSGTNTSLFTLAKAQAVVEVDGVQKMTYLGCNGSSFSFAEQTAISTDIQTTLTPQDLGYTYHIINLSKEKSLFKAADDLEGVHIPYELSSPAVDNDSYKYYTSSSFTIGSDGLYTLKEDAQPIESNSQMPYDEFDIYVTYTYTYNAETSYYDLTGSTEYSIIMNDGSYASVLYNDNDKTVDVWAPVPDENEYINPNNDADNNYSIYDSRALWNLSGNDPYKVGMRNCGRTKLAWIGCTDKAWKVKLYQTISTNYKSTHFAILNMKEGNLRVVGVPYSYKNTDGQNKTCEWFCFNPHDMKITFNTLSTGVENSSTRIVKREKPDYTYILKRKTDGKEIRFTEGAYVGADIAIPRELHRHFCTYKFYTDENLTNEATKYTENNFNIYVDYTVQDGIFMADGETHTSNPEKTFFIDAGNEINYTYNSLSQHVNSSDGREIYSDNKVNNDFEKIKIKGLENQNNRFNKSTPDYFVWYFRGDPYDCHVFNIMAPDEDLVPMHRKQALNIKRYRRDVQLSNSMMKSINQDKNDGEDDFHWEMVDSRRGMAEDGMCFALRFKETVGEVARPESGDAVPERELGKYYFLTPANAMNDPDNTGTRRLNYADGENFDKVMMEGGKIYTFDKNNTFWSALTLRRQARVSASVYNATNLASSVTKNEVSEYYAVGEKFDALPANLRRKFCTYTLIDPDDLTDLSGTTLYSLTKPKYGPNGKIQTHYIYARYRVDEVNPFTSATETDGQKVLEDANTKWFNFKFGNQYVYFNRNYVGKDDNVNDNDHRIIRKTINLNDKDDEGNYILPKDILYKGLHWAFVGDPYKFYVIGHRHRTATYDATGYKMTAGEVGYLDIGTQNEICMSADREYFTFMMDATNNSYFMSLSQPRMTAQDGNGNFNIKQGNYYEDRNYYGFAASSGDNYSRGENMALLRVKAEEDADKETAQSAVFGQAAGNDVFDCILNVYNGENKVVASSGWTELLRSDAVDAKSLPLDIQRYGCTYKCWGDATMTKKQVARYDEKMKRGDRWDYDGSGNPDEEVYVLDDGCFIYTNYSYNSAHYSSENNYHWVNCRFNWTDVTSRTSVWKINKHVKYLKTDSQGQEAEWYGDSWSNDFDKSLDVATDQVRYLSSPAAPEVEPSSPYVIDNKVFGDVETDQRDNEDKKDAILWALVGDPYEFQIKSYLYRNNPFENYYLKVLDSDKTGSTNYLKTAKQDAVDYNINNRPADQPLESTLTPAQKQGFTFTYKVDADGKPYLALKNESATALSRRDPNDILIGAVKSYVTFDYAVTNVEWFDNESATVGETTYTRGTEYDITTGTDVYKEGEQYVQSQLPFQEIKDSQFKNVKEKRYVYTLKSLDDTYIYPVGGMSKDENKLETGGAKNFYVEPMTVTAKQVVFRLKYFRSKTETGYPQTSDFATLNLPTEYFNENKPYPVTLRPEITGGDYLAKDYVVENYGVGTSLLLPWSYRRQYCKYFYRLVDVLETTDDVNYTSIKERADIQPYIGKFYDILEETFGNYKVVFDVYYQATEDYVTSTSADDAFWYNLTTTSVNTGEIEPVNFSYLNNMHKGPRTNHYTDDWLWAMEGDPYGMKLHNRYAQTWDEVLTIPTIPLTVNVENIIDPTTGEAESTDDFKTIIADPSVRGTYSTVNKENPTQETTTDSKGNPKTIYHNSHFFEMMQGNYSKAFLLHPVDAEIQDAYPSYFISMFLFNAGIWQVQLNEMLDREAKRNAAANWTLQPLAKDQLYVYYQRRGYVGGLDPAKITDDNKALFEKLSPTGSATYADLKDAQKIVHKKENLVPLQKGYYRIKAMSDEALTAYEADKTTYDGNRYVTGYLSDTEMTAATDNKPVILNFWATTEENKGNLEHSDLPAEHINQSYNRELLAANYDPSSIFYFVPDNEATVDDHSLWNIMTQDLYVRDGFTMGKEKATGTASETDTRLRIDDIGGTLFTIREGQDMTTGYLNCSPDIRRFAINKGVSNELHEAYDIQDTKWLLQPVDIPDEDIPEAMPLKFEMLYGNDGYYYCSAYLPYDIILSTGNNAGEVKAYIATGKPYLEAESQQWKIMCKEIGSYNKGSYNGNDTFVPAHTPVLIVSNNSVVNATIPTTEPTSTTITDNKLFGSLLAREVAKDGWASEAEKTQANNEDNQVYVFGMANDVAYFYLNGNANPHNGNSFDTKYLFHNKAFLIESNKIDQSMTRSCIPVFYNLGTDIDEITDEEDESPRYDLSGRRIYSKSNGIYIQSKRKKLKKQK